LYLLREAVDPEETEGAPPDVAGVIEGFMPSWKCSKCGMVRTWIPGQETLAEILKQMRGLHPGPSPQSGEGSK